MMMNPLDAEALARRGHAGQVDKQGAPYIDHPARVAAAVPLDCQAVAWCHDLLEDTRVTLEEIEALGPSPAEVIAIQALTRRPWETYQEYISRVVWSGNRIAREVKGADLQDNLRPGCTASMRARYLEALDYLKAGMKGT